MRKLLAALVLLLPDAMLHASPSSPVVVGVLAAPDVEAYSEAIEGLKAGLHDPSVIVRVFPLEKNAATPSIPAALTRERPRVVVAMGSEAMRALEEAPIDAPVLYTMALRADMRVSGAARQKTIASIPLDVPMEALAAHLKEVFPGRGRLGIIRQADGQSPAPMPADARQYGLTIVMAECRKPEDVLRAFLSLKGKVDFVWCVPDGSLYNSATVQPLLIASLNNRLPVIGFSASFVRAGALLGVYAPFRGIGGQAAETVHAYLADGAVTGLQAPRNFEVSVNQRVARLLGLQPELSERVVLFR